MADSEIKTKDVKILWSRAAGLCSMPDCRRKLTMDDSELTTSLVLGQMCHIVGEKNSEKSPRGLSKLPLEERNNYSNLLLLCAHHHTEIDKNVSDWPIEVLHKIKDDHELWVEETLVAKKLTSEEIIYSALVDNLTDRTQLKVWHWFSDHALRNLVNSEAVEALDFVDGRILATIWPGKHLELEIAIKDFMNAYSDFLHHFLKNASLHIDRDYYREDVSFKSTFNENYDIFIRRNTLWRMKNHYLLCILTCRLNTFAAAVRKYLNPLFFLTQGNFLIIDQLGTTNDGRSYLCLPNLNEVESLLKETEEKILLFEKEHPNFAL